MSGPSGGRSPKHAVEARDRLNSTPTDSDQPAASQSEPERASVERCIRDGRWAELVETLGYEPTGVSMTPRSAGSWGLETEWLEAFERVEIIGVGAGLRIILVEGDTPWRHFRRGVVRAARERPSLSVMWWWDRGETAVVALPDHRERGGWHLQSLETSRVAPDPAGLEQWTRLSASAVVGDAHGDETERMARHIGEVLSEEGLTREFFEGFSDALDLLCQTMEGGPEEEQRRHDIALSTLLRCLFLYFLQARDWLDGDRRYIARHLERCGREDRSFYDTVLRPLFFGALNCEPTARTGRATDLGELPFLNGGLFEPLPVEREFEGLSWSNEVWREIVGDLLERYHFTVEPTHGADERRVVDPEMLGKVFEGLMYGNRRKESGSYYTPRDVVRRLVLNALTGYLEDSTGLSEQRLEAWLAEGGGAQDRELESVEWTDEQRAGLREALNDLRLLDPAVGTGAFLLEAFHLLRGARRRLDGDGAGSFEDAVDLVHRSLFGVDIQRTAVRLCELRLWLALLPMLRERTIETLPPLPNLGHRIMCGDSLITPPGRPGGGVDAFDGSDDRDASPVVANLRDLHGRYLRAHGNEKVELRRRLDEQIRDRQLALLTSRRDALRRRLDPLANLSESEDLFGDEVELTADQQAAREQIEEELSEVLSAIADLQEGRADRAGFDFETHFGPALSSSGFDVVATNPPWVRTRRIEADKRRQLKARYRCFRNELWDGAKQAGIRTPFGLQVDLSSVFVERALGLLAPGGRLSVLIPAKALRSLHGAGLRRELGNHDVIRVEDYSEASESMFDATVYPTVLEVRKSAHGGGKSSSASRASDGDGDGCAEVSVWRGESRRTFRRGPDQLRVISDDAAAPWVVVPEAVLDGLETLFECGPALGAANGIEVQRGVMTGKNEVFIDELDRFDEEFGEFGARRWTRPVIGGRDIEADGITATRRIIWPVDDDLSCREELPEVLEAYFEARRSALEGRADHRSGAPLWQLFRINEGVDRPKVVWRDLAPTLQAAVAPAEVVPLNTVYFMPFEDEWRARAMVEWLHSLPVRVAARAIAERARGGWRRHFAWVMRLIPVPTDLARWFAGDLSVDSLTDESRRFVERMEEDRALAPGERCELVAEIVGWSDAQIAAAKRWFVASMPAGDVPDGFDCACA